MVKPARLVTLAFEPGLVERLSTELAESPHSLLLLQCVLVELWQRHQGGLLRHAFYDDFGRARGVVAHRAEQLFQGLTLHQQALARRVLVRLGATRPAGGLGLARLAASLEVDAPGLRRGVLIPLAEAGFLSLRSDPVTGRPTVAITQPALAPYWPRWQAWLNEAREFGLWRERLGEAMTGWNRAEPKKQSLLQGPALAEAEYWLSERREWLDSEGWIFIWQSLAHWRWQRDRRGLAGMGLVLLLIVGLAWLLVQQQMLLATLVAFSPTVPANAEHPWLATTSRDGSIRVWEVLSVRKSNSSPSLIGFLVCISAPMGSGWRRAATLWYRSGEPPRTCRWRRWSMQTVGLVQPLLGAAVEYGRSSDGANCRR